MLYRKRMADDEVLDDDDLPVLPDLVVKQPVNRNRLAKSIVDKNEVRPMT